MVAGGKNRLATIFWYMSTVGGGETNFPRAGGKPAPHNAADCSFGLSVAPEKGKVILFYSMDGGGGLDYYSLHAGCPVLSGTKWAANKWLWNKPQW